MREEKKQKEKKIIPTKKHRKTKGYWSKEALRLGKEVWEREREGGHGR
jgi:hypothetical protein